MTECPSWAKSMVSNYRRMFRAKYGKDTFLSDGEIFVITETVHNDGDPSQGDMDRVEAMMEKEVNAQD